MIVYRRNHGRSCAQNETIEERVMKSTASVGKRFVLVIATVPSASKVAKR
jgi:hypothetical protein